MTSKMRQYQDLPMNLADASLVLLAERLGHGRIVSTDQRDFRNLNRVTARGIRMLRHQPQTNSHAYPA